MLVNKTHYDKQCFKFFNDKPLKLNLIIGHKILFYTIFRIDGINKDWLKIDYHF